MSERQETDDRKEFQRIMELVPEYRGLRPPLSLVARVWALIDVPAGDGFVYAESHQEGDNSHTAWTIVVADSSHLVHVHAEVPVRGWARGQRADFPSLSRTEENIEVTARRLPFEALTEVGLAGTSSDWLTAGGPPRAPAWDLHWGHDISVRLPIHDDRLAHEARSLVLGLNRR